MGVDDLGFGIDVQFLGDGFLRGLEGLMRGQQ